MTFRLYRSYEASPGLPTDPPETGCQDCGQARELEHGICYDCYCERLRDEAEADANDDANDDAFYED